MPNEKLVYSRQQQKYDTSERWTEAGEKGFVPKAGEIIVYSDLNKIKVGDGITNVNSLNYVDGSVGKVVNFLGEIFNTYVTDGYFAKNEAGPYAHAEGGGTKASGNVSHAEGSETVAAGPNAHAQNRKTQANADNSHAQNINTIANGKDSTVSGDGSQTTSKGSHGDAGGYQTVVDAAGGFTRGYKTKVSGPNARANGENSEAWKSAASADGAGVIAGSNYQHAQGSYNVIDTEDKYVHIIGNGHKWGNEETRSNAHTLDWSGNAWFAGEVYIGGTSQDDPSAKKLSELGGTLVQIHVWEEED